ncbi:DNA replication/repair protein RecF [Peptococcus simiae]|uniref:DNA replication and repair protein RecF n=1 Tax=Peptococcus simiae TaxID=1643805 RepID=A0ABW9GZF0_9FIRM
MLIQGLQLAYFRNYRRVDISPAPVLNLLIGPNGQGKTNLIESLYTLSVGHGFRAAKDRDLIYHGAEAARLKAIIQAEGSRRQLPLELAFNGHAKRWRLNGVSYRQLQDLPDRLLAVLFTPDDLAVVKGSPDERRRFLDRELGLVNPGYDLERRKYRKLLAQRNELLKDIRAGRAETGQLSVWDRNLAQSGARLIADRLDFLRHLVPRARQVHEHMARKAGFNITYQASLGAQVKNEGAEDLERLFLEALADQRQHDIRAGSTSIGPHRDDLVFYASQEDLRTFGSQGQQRTAILALKLAEVDVIRQRCGSQPILLLDDVLSELDPIRQRLLLEAVVDQDLQTFISSTHLDLSHELFKNSKVFSVQEGNIIPKG